MEQAEESGEERQGMRREEKNKRQKTSKNEAAGITSRRGEGRDAIVRFISDSVDATHGRAEIQLENSLT